MKSNSSNLKNSFCSWKISGLLAILTSFSLISDRTLVLALEPNSHDNQLEIVQADATVKIDKIEVVSSTVFKTGAFDSIIKPLEGQTVTLEQLSQVAEQITQLYLDRGYLNSRALPPASLNEVKNGVATIQVIEGSLSEIIIEGTDTLEEYVRKRVKLGAGFPLNVPNLEDRLRLLKNDPLFENVEASLRPGNQRNQTIIVVRVSEAKQFFGNASVDNYSPPSIGGERFNLNLAYRNLTNSGDLIRAVYRPRLRNFDGTYELDFNYRLPLNPQDGTLQLDAKIYRSSIIEGPFEGFGINSQLERYNARYRQPIIRSPRQELALSFGFSFQDGQTFLFQSPTPFGIGPDENGVSRTSVFEIGQEYTLRQPSGAWGIRSLFRIGVDLFNATTNPDPIPDGRFFAWLAQLQRVQVINDNNFIIFQLDSQLTPDSLLPSEQLAIGGGRSVRGYRQNARSGDNGLRFSIEDRITLFRNTAEEPIFVLAPFFDLGYVWNDANNPNFLPDQRFLAGLGLGVIWQPVENFNIRLDYAPPLIDLVDRGNDIQDNGFYFRLGYDF